MKSTTMFLVVIVSIGLLVLYAWPQWQTVGVLQDKHTELQDAQLRVQELTQLRDGLVAQYESIPPEDVQRLKKVIPVEYNPIKLTADLNAIALRQGMVIREVTFVDKEGGSNTGDGSIVDAPPETLYKVVGVSFSTEGQYKNFTALLADLEKNLQILDIRAIDIATKSQADNISVPMLDFRITLDTYWMN